MVVDKNHRHAGRMLGIFAGLSGGGRLIIASILFASASFGGGCSTGAYQQIVKNMQKKIIQLKKNH